VIIRPARESSRDRERGIALITVLWGLVILALIAAALLSAVRVTSRLAATTVARAQVTALAEAGLQEAVLGLLDRRPDHRWRVDGVPRTVGFAGTQLTITVWDEYGKIDLNNCNRELLQGLLTSAGLDSASVDPLVDKILDWREAGSLKRLNGAKADDYRAAGYDYRPRQGAFQTVDELRLVMDMAPELFERIRPALTIYAQKRTFNTQTAPREALLALPGMDAVAADTLLATRGSASSDSAASGPVAGGVIDPAIPTAGWPFTIRVEIPTPGGRFVRETVVRLTGDPARPYWVLARHDGS
jgi:general secretion pathway protein K